MATTHIQDSNFAIDEIKLNPRQIAELNLNMTGDRQNISNIGIASKDIKIKLDLVDDDFVISSCTVTEAIVQQDSSESGIETLKTNIDKIRKKSPVVAPFLCYMCEICGKFFLTKSIISDHMVTHTGEKNYKCGICTKCFSTKRNLSKHKLLHSSERNYKCEICSKCFKVKSVLSRHMTVHTRKRNYKCEICRKCFVTKYLLSNHMVAHSCEKNYKCEICRKCFAREPGLLTHMRKHRCENYYKCEICSNWFITRNNLTEHMKLHNGTRDLFLEFKKSHLEETTEKQPARNFSYKEMATTIKKENLQIVGDIIYEGPSKAANVATKIEEKLNLTEIFDSCKTLNSEIIVKEEEEEEKK